MNKKATSFLEFWKLVRELKPASDEAILFRGHPDEKWFLEPGVFQHKGERPRGARISQHFG